MSIEIPSMADVREAMRHLTLKQIATLAGLSGVPAPTIYKIKRGETPNPGMDTVAKFMPHLKSAMNPKRTPKHTTEGA